jgi:hypothetical protein
MDIEKLIVQIESEICKGIKPFLDLIIVENARIENYFSVIVLKALSELRTKKKIRSYKFQHLLTNSENKRKHIDFFIVGKGFTLCLEIKHLAIDTNSKEKNNRNINFYTSNSLEGRKVGIIGDLEKLNNIKTNEITDYVSFSIITNTPQQKVIDERINYLLMQQDTINWTIKSSITESKKLSFIICKKSL